MPVLDCVFEERIHYRYERPAHQLAEKKPNPDPADCYGGDDVHPADRERHVQSSVLADARARADQEIHVDESHEQYEYGYHRETLRLALQILLQEDQERSRKVEQDQSPCDPSPAAGRSEERRVG